MSHTVGPILYDPYSTSQTHKNLIVKQSLSKSIDDNPHTMALILYEIKKMNLRAVI